MEKRVANVFYRLAEPFGIRAGDDSVGTQVGDRDSLDLGILGDGEGEALQRCNVYLSVDRVVNGLRYQSNLRPLYGVAFAFDPPVEEDARETQQKEKGSDDRQSDSSLQ